MKFKVLLIAAGLVLVAAGCNKQAATNNPPTDTTSDQTSQATDQSSNSGTDQTGTQTDTTPSTGTQTNPPATTQKPPANTQVQIAMTDTGFSPATITVKAGTTVVFKNTGSDNHWPASNPHPVHTGLPGFDALKAITPGGTYSYTFTKAGTWGFHDHLHPNFTGSVVVTQ